MENENSKPYFLLVFQKNDPMPSIVSADVISEMYPDKKNQNLEVIDKNGNNFSFDNVRMFKIVPAENINYDM